jgi:hypothetical protein
MIEKVGEPDNGRSIVPTSHQEMILEGMMIQS